MIVGCEPCFCSTSSSRNVRTRTGDDLNASTGGLAVPAKPPAFSEPTTPPSLHFTHDASTAQAPPPMLPPALSPPIPPPTWRARVVLPTPVVGPPARARARGLDASTDDNDDLAVANLLDAAMEGDLSHAKRTSIDKAVAAAAKRRRPLHLAAANGKVEMCKFQIRSCEVAVDASDADVTMRRNGMQQGKIGWRGKFTRPGHVIRPRTIRMNGKCLLTPLEGLEWKHGSLG